MTNSISKPSSTILGKGRKERVLAKGQTFEQFKWFLDYAEEGLQLSSGFGIGIERLVRYICGFKRIEDVHPFPKTPGKFSI